MKVRVEAYTRTSAARDAIQEGDLVMFRGGPLHDQIIEIGTNGIYCHSALAYLEPDPLTGEKRVFLIQATKAKGVHAALLSDEIADFQGGMEHWRIKAPYIDRYVAATAIREARSQVPKPYAMTPIFWFALDYITCHLFNLRAKKVDPNAWFCSELVAWAARKGGVDLDPKHGDAATAPSDLVTHGRADCIGAFARPDVVAKAS